MRSFPGKAFHAVFPAPGIFFRQHPMFKSLTCGPVNRFLQSFRAFQTGNSLQVGFQVSESLAGAKAYVEILDMKGKVLSSVSGTAVSGSNVMTLQTPKSGLYMVRVRVGSKQAAGSVAIK